MINKFLNKISRIIFRLIPEEFKYRKKKSLVLLLEKEKNKKILETFGEEFKKSLLFEYSFGIQEIRKYAIEKSLDNDPNEECLYLEFGVFTGLSTSIFSSKVKKLYAFDSFEGLREDWAGSIFPKGSFNLNKKVPNLDKNVVPVVGWVQDTLDDFLIKNPKKINFIHMDLDSYESSLFVLKKVKKQLANNAVILFDQLYNFLGWEHGEYKAFKEVFNEDEFKYLAFNLDENQVVVQIKK